MAHGVDLYRYEGKRVLVVGGATGMGAAAAKAVAALGGAVVVVDRVAADYAVTQMLTADLLDRASIDAALAELTEPVDAVFSAAGIAGGDGVTTVNFIAHRHIIDGLLERELLPRGSAICFISSVAGVGWQNYLDELVDFLATRDYEAATSWVKAHEGTDTYMFSKQAINAYVARQAFPLLGKGIRINAICPGPTDTPLARANGWLAFDEQYREAAGVTGLQPEQMANVMAFLNSTAADGISGVSLLVDAGNVMASIGGSWEPGGPVIELLMTQRF